MSAESPTSVPASDAVSAEKRQRLQQLFQHATLKADLAIKPGGKKDNFDYANDLFMQCVLGDPGNRVYVQALLDNLYRKFNNKKKGSLLGGFMGGGGGQYKRLAAKKDWLGVIRAGISQLKSDPWDAVALLAMADACEHLGYFDTQLAYLKSAWVGNPKNADVNRTCAHTLARRGRFDEAAECWRRVKLAKPTDDEADRAMAQLAVDKTIKHGNYGQAETTIDAMVDKQTQAERKGEAQAQTPEVKFRQRIAEKPEDLTNYLELAELLAREDRLADAEDVYAKALTVSAGDLKIREYLEDTQLRHARQQIRIAEQRATAEPTEANLQLVKTLKAELNRTELDVYRGRTERYPSNAGFRYEYGVRLKKAGNFSEAIKYLQDARGDAKRKGLVHLELGECFQQVKQYKLAMTAYETALEAITDKEPDARKLALYRAGVLSMGLKDYDKAEKNLSELAGLDFNFRDVSERLDKLAKLRDNE